jgi:hypothetical protein
MSKMSLHHPFGHLKHKLWPNEGPKVKLAIWLLTTKSKKSTQFPACRWRATHCWKDFAKGYNFASDLNSIWGLHAKLWSPKVARVPTLAISRLPLGSPETKSYLDVGPVGIHRVYYKEEGGDFPQVRAVVNFVNPSCPWFVLAPKVLQLCSNLFFGHDNCPWQLNRDARPTVIGTNKP